MAELHQFTPVFLVCQTVALFGGDDELSDALAFLESST